MASPCYLINQPRKMSPRFRRDLSQRIRYMIKEDTWCPLQVSMHTYSLGRQRPHWYIRAKKKFQKRFIPLFVCYVYNVLPACMPAYRSEEKPVFSTSWAISPTLNKIKKKKNIEMNLGFLIRLCCRNRIYLEKLEKDLLPFHLHFRRFVVTAALVLAGL